MAECRPEDLDSLFARSLGKDHCFLCAEQLTQATRTSEHVVPKWTQQRFRLWDQRVILPNRTELPYRQLTVPCCVLCNNQYLQPLETRVASATAKGPEAVEELGRETLFLWLGKLFYGLLYRDCLLREDRSRADSPPLMGAEELRRYGMHHLFLQMLRWDLRCEGFFPASILVFETQPPDTPELQWDLRDSIDHMFIAVRMGRTGIIANLQDSGVQADSPHPLMDFRPAAAHPLQYLELCAFFAYRSSLFNRTPKYVVLAGPPVRIHQMPLMGLSAKPLFDAWDSRTYAQVLASYAGIPLERAYSAPDKVLTWLRDPSGQRVELPLDRYPWPQ